MNSVTAWLSLAERFLDQVKELTGMIIERQVVPGITRNKLDKLDGQLRLRMPASLRSFLLACDTPLEFRYNWFPLPHNHAEIMAIFHGVVSLRGGGHLWNVDAFLDTQEGCLDWGRAWVNRVDKASEGRIWMRSFPWISIGDGDFIAFDLEHNVCDPPVVYLSHEGIGASRVVADCLWTFLKGWEECCYLGPDIGMLMPFLDDPQGFRLGIDSTKLRIARMFGIRV